MLVSQEKLALVNACKDQAKLFEEWLSFMGFEGACPVTEDNLLSAHDYGLDVRWAATRGLLGEIDLVKWTIDCARRGGSYLDYLDLLLTKPSVNKVVRAQTKLGPHYRYGVKYTREDQQDAVFWAMETYIRFKSKCNTSLKAQAVVSCSCSCLSAANHCKAEQRWQINHLWECRVND